MIRTASIRRLKRSPIPGMNYRYAVRIPGFERRILVTTKDDALRALRHQKPASKQP